MKCHICEENFGEEAGWFICDKCKKKLTPYLIEGIMTGELLPMQIQNRSGDYVRLVSRLIPKHLGG